jgi:transcriptional regulator with XRE-family HTH domain
MDATWHAVVTRRGRVFHDATWTSGEGKLVVYRHVGKRLRERRVSLGMSQEQLARTLGVSFQQVQRCESGANRVTAARLLDLSKVLDVPIAFFFDGLPGAVVVSQDDHLDDDIDDVEGRRHAETLELIRAYWHIESSAVRKRMFALIRSMATETGSTSRLRRRG